MNIYLLAVTIVLVNFICDTEGECILPKPSQKIQWEKMSGNWFQTLNRGDYLDKDNVCYYYLNMKSGRDGAYFDMGVFEVNKPESKTIIPIHAIRQDTEEFLWDHEWDQSDLDWMIQPTNGTKETAEGVAEMETVYSRLHVYHTDYENFLIEMQCSETGEKMIWTHGKSPHPTADHVLQVRNKLIDLARGWESVHLRLSDCNNMEI